MGISTRMTALTTAVGLVLFGTYGLLASRSEERELNRAALRELELLGRSAQEAIENALRDRQIDDTRDLLARLETIDPTVDLMIFDTALGLVGASLGSRHDAPEVRAMARRVTGEQARAFDWVPPDDPEVLLAAFPLTIGDDAPAGALVISRPLTELRQDLATTERNVAISVGLFVAASAALGLMLGTLYIGRPLARMANAMRRVRSGDLESGLTVERDDEVGAVAREFNGMVDELRATRRLLEEEAESRRQLQRVLQEADKLITIGQLSAGLAHEIGSPLQVLAGRARALVQHPDDPARTRRNADILVAQSERIQRIVEQLLEFARRRPARLSRVSLVEPVQAVIHLLAYEVRRRGLRVVAVVTPDVPDVEADPDQIQQVALNLITNAMNVTPAGGTITVRLSRGVMPASDASAGAPSACLEVVDTGPGIPEAARERLFEPFFTTRVTEGGTGLGLAVVRGIVTAHRGALVVASSDAGTRFTISLPAAEVDHA